jgi:hypothetical protein
MKRPRNGAPGSDGTLRRSSLSRRGLAALIGSLALFHVTSGDAKKEFGKRHPHRPPCAEIGERPSGMRKRKGRKARPGRRCCEGLETDLSGVCVEPPIT